MKLTRHRLCPMLRPVSPSQQASHREAGLAAGYLMSPISQFREVQ